MKAIHNRKWIAGIVLGLVFLSGCQGAAKAPEQVEQNSLVLRQNGGLTAYIVDVFDKSYYDVDGLKAMAEEEVSSYNSTHTGEKDSVTLNGIETGADGSLVVVSYDFAGAGAYASFMGTRLFYGTVAEAEQAGYRFGDMNQILVSPSGNKSIVTDSLGTELSGKHVALVEEGTNVYCPYKVAYISENAVVMEDGSINTAGVYEDKYPAVIVMEK